MSPAISVEELSKSYKSRGKSALAVDKVSFEVNKGEVFGLLGPNGAGKTTTLLLILGFLKPDTGGVRIFDKDPYDMEVRAKIGYTPENPVFHDYLTGEEFLSFHAGLHRIDKKECQKLVPEMLRKIGLEDAADKRLSAYSKGMLQRISLGQALLIDPEILFFDEPTLGLDPLGIIDVRNLILELKERGKTVFLNSHQLSEVEKVCDKVIFMKHGKLLQTLSLTSPKESLEDLFVRIVKGE